MTHLKVPFLSRSPKGIESVGAPGFSGHGKLSPQTITGHTDQPPAPWTYLPSPFSSFSFPSSSSFPLQGYRRPESVYVPSPDFRSRDSPQTAAMNVMIATMMKTMMNIGQKSHPIRHCTSPSVIAHYILAISRPFLKQVVFE